MEDTNNSTTLFWETRVIWAVSLSHGAKQEGHGCGSWLLGAMCDFEETCMSCTDAYCHWLVPFHFSSADIKVGLYASRQMIRRGIVRGVRLATSGRLLSGNINSWFGFGREVSDADEVICHTMYRR